jgi:predicted RNase H-related nuclease YkuK (DUF458 family)|tara:strand:+ start:415 stop:897 length:483 start_codon:yes stop_codon:yes gene_type:complete
MRVFRNIKGEVVDVIKHTLDVMREHPDVEIHIGTDSQNKKRNTSYATVIAYRYGTRGVHVIFSRLKVKKVKNLWDRLWKEAEDSINVALWMNEKINVKLEIDMDYNPNRKFDSFKLISAAKGWATGLGFKVNVKPELDADGRTNLFENYACKAADNLVRH